MNNKASNIAYRAELGRYTLIFDINKRILKYISYLQNKEQSSLVIQSLVMSIDLHRNGKTSFYTNLITMLNRPFSKMAAENLNKSKLKTNTSTRKSTLTLVTLPSFSILGEISAEKM